jgi:hypothetical protein
MPNTNRLGRFLGFTGDAPQNESDDRSSVLHGRYRGSKEKKKRSQPSKNERIEQLEQTVGQLVGQLRAQNNSSAGDTDTVDPDPPLDAVSQVSAHAPSNLSQQHADEDTSRDAGNESPSDAFAVTTLYPGLEGDPARFQGVQSQDSQRTSFQQMGRSMTYDGTPTSWLHSDPTDMVMSAVSTEKLLGLQRS